MTETEPHAWQAFLVNFLFFFGVAQGGVMISGAFYLTQARWGGPGAYRLAESFYVFIPVAFVLFWVLFFGRAELWPWVTRPELAKNPTWLNTPFFFAREGFCLLALTMLDLWFIRISHRVDVRQWALSNDNIEMPPTAIRRIAPALALTYAAVMSLIAFDLIMSLAPLWKSTLFGAFFFAGAFWSGIVAMALTAVVLRGRLGAGNLFTRDTIMHDLGKFTFAFSVFWAYTLFAQYIVIWYGDIPDGNFFSGGARRSHWRTRRLHHLHPVDDPDLDRAGSDLGDSVHGADGRQAEEDARDPRHRRVSRPHRHVARALCTGGPVDHRRSMSRSTGSSWR